MCIFEELTMVVHFWRTYFGLPDQAKLIKYTPHCGKGYEAVAALCQLDYLEIERLNVQTDLNLINFSRESKKTRKKRGQTRTYVALKISCKHCQVLQTQIMNYSKVRHFFGNKRFNIFVLNFDTAANICFTIQSNSKFSPKVCAV